MSVRKKYNYNNPRLPAFTSRFIKLVDEIGGVTKASEITGISRPTINFWYNGERTPDAENLKVLSESFHVSVDYLLGLTEPNNSTTNEMMSAVCEYTGLSNTAVERLVSLKKKRDSRAYTDLLNCLLSDVDLEYFLGLLEGYFSENKVISEVLAMSAFQTNQKDFALFAASNALGNILDRVAEQFKSNEYLTSNERLDIIMQKKLDEAEEIHNGSHS